MIIGTPLSFITEFVENPDEINKTSGCECQLTPTQKYWLAFCITAIIMTNSVCWAKFERAGLGQYRVAALSWMLRCSMIAWETLLRASITYIIGYYGISGGTLAADDSLKKRSGNTKRISEVRKMKDTKTNGYIMGQCVVFLFLVTPVISIPVGFMFYMPDPKLTEWYKLKKSGNCPKKPPKDPNYPTKQEIALTLLKQFKADHPCIRIRCLTVDNLYCSREFFEQASEIFGKIQIISRLRSTQNIRYRNRVMQTRSFFETYPGVSRNIGIRGGEPVNAVIAGARLYVCSHKTKRFVIAVKYEGETGYRYPVASDLTWRTEDIIKAFALRWLTEVFIQDRKSYEGWNSLTKQRDNEGSERTLILSLLTDHCLFFHPDQKARLQNKLSPFTAGSLTEKSKAECLLSFIRDLVLSGDAESRLDKLQECIRKTFKPSLSAKHMINRELGNLAPSPSLKYKTA